MNADYLETGNLDKILTTSTSATNITNCGSTYTYYPYYSQPTIATYGTITVNSSPEPTHTIRKVENGFVVRANRKEFVFETIEKLNKFLLKDLK